MSHEMTIENKIRAAEALVRWFEAQDMSYSQSVSVALVFIAECYIEAANKDADEPKMRDDIVGLFDSFVALLRM
jgi:hypothetical protein